MRTKLRHNIIRVAFLPIYGIDQALFVVGLLGLTLALSIIIGGMAIFPYFLAGGYTGYVVTMIRSTPARLILLDFEVPLVKEYLNSSPFLTPTRQDSWQRRVSRAKRWKTDDLRLFESAQGARLTGRFIDLLAVEDKLDL